MYLKKLNFLNYFPAVCLCAIAVCLPGNFLCASAEDLRLPADCIYYDEIGTDYYDFYQDYEQNFPGKICSKPNFLLGDVNADNVV
ncbi:MAG: hypothetical protein K2G25_04290, partial [Oscillospiraceae bacterium]|nr:hypothetical protein [Oscillospiraceae bacterium]